MYKVMINQIVFNEELGKMVLTEDFINLETAKSSAEENSRIYSRKEYVIREYDDKKSNIISFDENDTGTVVFQVPSAYIYVVQMEEVIEEEDSTGAINIWEDFYDETEVYEVAKKNAFELIQDIKAHKISEIFEVEESFHSLAIAIAVYDKRNKEIRDVVTIGEIEPADWNVTCGSCGAYCEEGTCFKYGNRVEENTIAPDCWHCL